LNIVETKKISVAELKMVVEATTPFRTMDVSFLSGSVCRIEIDCGDITVDEVKAERIIDHRLFLIHSAINPFIPRRLNVILDGVRGVKKK
jgi:hypothetical protein